MTTDLSRIPRSGGCYFFNLFSPEISIWKDDTQEREKYRKFLQSFFASFTAFTVIPDFEKRIYKGFIEHRFSRDIYYRNLVLVQKNKVMVLKGKSKLSAQAEQDSFILAGFIKTHQIAFMAHFSRLTSVENIAFILHKRLYDLLQGKRIEDPILLHFRGYNNASSRNTIGKIYQVLEKDKRFSAELRTYHLSEEGVSLLIDAESGVVSPFDEESVCYLAALRVACYQRYQEVENLREMKWIHEKYEIERRKSIEFLEKLNGQSSTNKFLS